MKITSGSVLQLTPGVLWAPVDEGIAILETAAGHYYGVDTVGARLWELMRSPCTIESLVESIVIEYDVAPELCAADVHAFVDALVADGLITVGTASSS